MRGVAVKLVKINWTWRHLSAGGGPKIWHLVAVTVHRPLSSFTQVGFGHISGINESIPTTTRHGILSFNLPRQHMNATISCLHPIYFRPSTTSFGNSELKWALLRLLFCFCFNFSSILLLMVMATAVLAGPRLTPPFTAAAMHLEQWVSVHLEKQ